MPTITFIIGRAGSGKGTLCKRYISEHRNCRWIESGGLIRTRLASDVALQTLINDGNLVPDETIARLVADEITSAETDVLLDGFPRTANQLLLLKSKLHGYKMKAVLVDVDESACFHRLLNRQDNRNDDYPEAIRRRFEIYDRNIRDIRELVELTVIDGDADQETVYHRFENAILAA